MLRRKLGAKAQLGFVSLSTTGRSWQLLSFYLQSETCYGEWEQAVNGGCLCGVCRYGVGGSGEGKPSPLHVGFSYLSEFT